MHYDIISFLKNYGFILLYGVALLISILRYPKFFDSVLKYFPIIIGYTFLTEILGDYIRKNENFRIIFMDEHSVNNSVIFNLFDIVFYVYFFFVFWKTLKSKKHKNLVKYGSLLFLATCLINPFFQDFVLYPQIYAITVGSIVLILCILLYFKQLKENKNGLPNLNNLLFWVALGLLVFYLAYPFLIIIGLSYSEIYTRFNVRLIHQLLICVMYICFIIGFLKMRRMKPLQEESM